MIYERFNFGPLLLINGSLNGKTNPAAVVVEQGSANREAAIWSAESHMQKLLDRCRNSNMGIICINLTIQMCDNNCQFFLSAIVLFL